MRCTTPWLCSVLVMSGCALSDGVPFGVADVSLQATFAPDPTRMDGPDLVTSRDFRVRIERLAIRVHQLVVEQSGEEAGAFDPASPPAGFSLCHNGHCHSDDGRLVPYAEIAATTAGGSSSSAVALEGDDEWVALSSTPTPVGFMPCLEGCPLSRGVLSRLVVDVGELEMEIEVRHPTLLPDAVPFVAEVEIEADVDAPLDVLVDDGEPLRVRISASLQIPESLFDDVDFSGTSTDAKPLSAALRDRINEEGVLRAVVERPDE